MRWFAGLFLVARGLVHLAIWLPRWLIGLGINAAIIVLALQQVR